MNTLQKLKEEYHDLMENLLSNIGCTVGLSNIDNLYEWKVVFICGKDSPYAGGEFIAKILFPENYPNSCPEVIFLTPIYHLNVNHKKCDQPLGHVCLNIINWWRPDTTIREVLMQLYSLFYLQNPDTPYDIYRAQEYIENRPLFELKVKYFTQKYANPINELKKFEDKDWDFSCSEKDLEPIKLKEEEKKEKEKENEKGKKKENDKSKEDINLNFTYNAKIKTTIQCGTDELMKNVFEKCMNKIGKSLNLEKTFLIFYDKKIDLNSSVKDYGLKNNYNIDIINVEADNWRIIDN
jgi:ubiquitin-protein ligase